MSGYLQMDAAIPKGYHWQNIDRTTWVVPVRYQNLTSVASGTYGRVWAFDGHRNRQVAIKKLSHPFQDNETAKRTYRELKLLNHFDHENVLDLLDVFTPDKCWQSMNDLYFVSTAMDCSLHDILARKLLRPKDVPFVLYQLLRGVKYLHGAGIIHRDLKPHNIGFNQGTNDLRILDFGLARSAEISMTGYVTTRWYRAPEVILNWMRYNQSDLDQLSRIIDLLGSPTEEFLGKLTCNNARDYVKSMPKRDKQDFNVVFDRASPEAVSLLQSFLQIDPDLRPSAAEALSYGYLKLWNVSDDEPVASPISILDSDNTVEEWKKIIWNEVMEITGKNSQ